MSSFAKLAIIGGAGYWAYQAGYLDAPLEKLRPYLGEILARKDQTDTQESAISYTPNAVPVIQPKQPEKITKEEMILNRNRLFLSAWSEKNLFWTAAIMHVESRGNPRAVSVAKAHGNMQVLLPTAKEIYAKGYTRFKPTIENLHREDGGIYFGTAYLEMMSKYNKGRDWTTRAYNGGPNFETNGNAPAQTLKYLQAVEKQFAIIIKNHRSA